MFTKLQYISQGNNLQEQLANIHEVLDSGCTWIQLRFKNAREGDIIKAAENVKELCMKYKSTFIVNDHPQVAKAVDANGVHLGLNDMPVAKARMIVGEEKIIGGTANTFEDVVKRYQERCTYAGVGPFRFTITKEKLSPVLGLEGLMNIREKMILQGIDIPVYAIGGIVLDDIEPIMQTGVHGVAISGAIANHKNKNQIIQAINSLMYAKTDNC